MQNVLKRNNMYLDILFSLQIICFRPFWIYWVLINVYRKMIWKKSNFFVGVHKKPGWGGGQKVTDMSATWNFNISRNNAKNFTSVSRHLYKKISENVFAYSCVPEHFLFLPYRNLHFLSGQGFRQFKRFRSKLGKLSIDVFPNLLVEDFLFFFCPFIGPCIQIGLV